MNKFYLTLCFPLSLLLNACANDQIDDHVPVASAQTQIDTAQGSVIGFTNADGVNVWRGIPYAQAPVGELRWRAPQPPLPWTGIRETLAWPNWCPQVTNALDELYGIEAGELRGNEDCLFLNIYAPPNTDSNSNLPVMVWVHGGSNTWGRSEHYDGSVLAREHNLIVVVVQYRLGPLGWFSHPALRESAVSEDDATANFAVLDLVASLRWVRDNIAAFGGNASRVTLFGESAGAQNIFALMVSPQAKGLFHGAIAQSAIPQSIPRNFAEQGHPRLRNASFDITEHLFGKSSPTAADLRALSLQALYAAYISEGRVRLPTVIADGVTVPSAGIADVFAETVAKQSLPLMMGSNRDEAKYVLAFDPRLVKRQFGLFPKPRDKEQYDFLATTMSQSWRALAIDEPVAQLIAHDVDHVYSYRFDWDEQGSYWLTDVSELIGAAHTMEIPFVFGVFDGFLGRINKMLFTEDNAVSRTELSRAMRSYWAEFAYSGKPGQGRNDRYATWPSVDNCANGATLLLDTHTTMAPCQPEMNTSIATILESVRNNSELQEEGESCFVASQLAQVFGLMDNRFEELQNEMCQ